MIFSNTYSISQQVPYCGENTQTPYVEVKVKGKHENWLVGITPYNGVRPRITTCSHLASKSPTQEILA